MDSEEPPNVRVACSGDIDEVRAHVARCAARPGSEDCGRASLGVPGCARIGARARSGLTAYAGRLCGTARHDCRQLHPRSA
ncbi:hypothetical protein FOZ74_01885 [Comamonas flocculans]|uniref:Uncharacterized protein n=1 Tax=Comamonas flocculans TaxID=2597701 RepID=A0A5B8RS32_9BURK|nr:hypothetical protein FOZ74_01885 [Comamonas flocculans]